MNTMQFKDMSWFKGSFPNWLLVLLLSVVSFIGKGMLNDLKEVNQKAIDHSIRLSVLELQSSSFKDNINELKLSNKDIIVELKNLTIQLKTSSK